MRRNINKTTFKEDKMDYKIDKNYNGFILVREEHIKEVNSIARIFEHEKTGARLLHMENDDSNKVFAIGFKTPPSDSTGVMHILEHSVLCGSRKFPTKEPFVELVKGSLNTFLNAMTYSDKTIYPIASQNEKDFFNLMDVYLDAVFYPNIYNTKEILMQEGWHYDLEDKNNDLTYKGVVYNEMKGAFSSPEGILLRRIQQTLFPDNAYYNESGGDPKYIPDLTYDQFIETHKKFYHPSNSYIFLYGDGNLEKELAFINDNYLSNFDKVEIDSHIDLQKPYEKMKEVTYSYSISNEDDESEKTFLSLNYVTGKSTDDEVYTDLNILEYILLEAEGAPLKKALIDAGIGKDVFGSFDNGIQQPVFSIIVKNSDVDKIEEFKNLVYSTLRDVVKNGIDKKLIEGCINTVEFKLREADTGSYPKGLVYYTNAMDSWLYGGDPLQHIKYEDALNSAKKALTTNHFEKLIEKYILNNNHASLLVLKPEKGLAEKNMLELKDIKKHYSLGEVKQQVLKGINLKFRRNEFTSILGASGSGKTTLLNIIGGLDQYDSGDLIIEGVSTKQYKDRDWDAYRNHRVGFIFQSYNLIMHQSVLANVEMALTLSGVGKLKRRKKAVEALTKVGLKEHIHKRPNQLSGGQMQRVAIARALVNDPEIILADEPTGALDSETSVQIMELLKEIAKDKLVIMVTHNPELAKQYSTRIIELKDGLILNDSNPCNDDFEETSSKTMKRTSMSIFTSLGLSLKNLLTKKGRTFLTAFAGSIGIIGIALILALSNGVSNYVKDMERNSMSDYPIAIEKTSIDLDEMLSSLDSNNDKKEGKDGELVSDDDISKEFKQSSVNVVKHNNTKDFKKYIEENQ